MILPPPLRFLLLVFGTWAIGRAVVLNLPEEVKAPARRLIAAVPAAPPASGPEPWFAPSKILGPADQAAPTLPAAASRPSPPPAGTELVLPRPTYTLRRGLPPPETDDQPVPNMVPPLYAHTAKDSRWAGSAWLFLRGRAGTSLAPGGTLGGSQAGGRLTYALGDRAALSARAYLPLEVPEEAEVAAGLDLKPLRQLPVRLLLERREAVGTRGRSAFSATLYGGVSEQPVAGPVRLDAYAQAGMVGLKSRDLFVDGSTRLHLKAGGIKTGIGLWAAAQPGAERVDVGPTLSIPLPIGTIQADWRFRVGGKARPGSGLAVTLAKDF